MVDIPVETSPIAEAETRKPVTSPVPEEAEAEEAFWADIPLAARESVGAYDVDTAGGCG